MYAELAQPAARTRPRKPCTFEITPAQRAVDCRSILARRTRLGPLSQPVLPASYRGRPAALPCTDESLCVHGYGYSNCHQAVVYVLDVNAITSSIWMYRFSPMRTIRLAYAAVMHFVHPPAQEC